MPGAATNNCVLPVGIEVLFGDSTVPVGIDLDVGLVFAPVGVLALTFLAFETLALALALAVASAGLLPFAFALALARLRAALDNSGQLPRASPTALR